MTRKPFFQDEVILTCQGGQGGHGLISFDLTFTHKSKGKPNGGMGGTGGNVYMIGKDQLDDLTDLISRKYVASKGKDGGKNCRAGAKGDDLYIAVPVHTSAFIYPHNLVLGQVKYDGDLVLLAQGGKSGVGNGIMHSAKVYGRQIGEMGESLELKFTYLLESDFAVVGPGNAGKSSLFNRLINHHKSHVADYMFSTQKPILGINNTSLIKRLAFLDTPAFDFYEAHIYLRYIQKTPCLLYTYDSSDVAGITRLQLFLDLIAPTAQTITIVITKIDLITPSQLRDLQAMLQALFMPSIQQFFSVSLVTEEGLIPLLASIIPEF